MAYSMLNALYYTKIHYIRIGTKQNATATNPVHSRPMQNTNRRVPKGFKNPTSVENSLMVVKICFFFSCFYGPNHLTTSLMASFKAQIEFLHLTGPAIIELFPEGIAPLIITFSSELTYQSPNCCTSFKEMFQ